jgi:VCBS repeat-containing protein
VLTDTDEETPISIDVLANASDPDGQSIGLARIDTTNTEGSATVIGNSVFYDPDDQFEQLGVGVTDTDTFTFTVADSQGGETTATATVTIRGVNDAPIGVNDGYNVIQGSRLNVNAQDGTMTPTNILDDGLLVNDTDIDVGDVLTATLLASPQNGIVNINSDGTFVYTHDGGISTSDLFTYEVSDGNGGADTVTVNLTIVPRPPSIWQNPSNRFDVNADSFVTPIDALLVINRLNTLGPGELPNPAIPPNAPPPFYDVNGDGFVTSNDVLQVINELNLRAAGGEGESLANPSLLGEGEADQVLALPSNSSYYGAALWSHLTQDQAASPTVAASGTDRSDSANPLVAKVQSHQQAVAIDQLFARGTVVELERTELDDSNSGDFNAGVDALFGDPFDLGLGE